MADLTHSGSLFGLGLLDGYAPLRGVTDEMIDASGAPRAHWRPLLAAINALGAEEIDARFDQAARRLRVVGASYRSREAPESEQPISLSRLPLVMNAADWRAISEGVVQRARLQEALLSNVYGPQTLFSSGALPATIVAGSPEFLRPLVNVKPRGGKFLRLYAADLGRGPDGRWWVIGDRTQAPSGAGYALESRLATSRVYAEPFGALEIERLAGFFQKFRESLAALAQPDGGGVCVLTPGPLNETYAEHAYLARYLGFQLVEGEDLTVRDDAVFVRTVAGLRRADVFMRRLDADFADPLELNATSRIGAPGLARAVRAGTVAFANALGAGLAESRALLGFMPMLAQRLLGEDLLLPNVATWWCGQERERQYVIDNLDRLAIAPAFDPQRRAVPGSELSADERTALLRALEQRGMDFVGQEMVSLSTMPLWREGRLNPRPFQLRVFAAATEDGWTVMPGGFCRISTTPDTRALALHVGGLTTDTWVLGDGPVNTPTLLPRAVEIRRHVGALTARAADNLFWFGRYLERAETVIRLVRAGHTRAALRGREESAVAQAISAQLAHWGAVGADAPPLTRKLALTALTDTSAIGSAAGICAAARRAAAGIRERLSMDVASAVDELAIALDSSVRPRADPGERADRALRLLAAISGFTGENMAQLTGWRFLEIGRRIERALNTVDFVRALGLELSSTASLETLLELGDSSITYAQRYFVAAAQRPILDLLLLDDNNPRACAFQIRKLRDLVRQLPGEATDEAPSPALRLADRLSAETIVADAGAVDGALLARLQGELLALSSAISDRYLVNRERLAFPLRIDE